MKALELSVRCSPGTMGRTLKLRTVTDPTLMYPTTARPWILYLFLPKVLQLCVLLYGFFFGALWFLARVVVCYRTTAPSLFLVQPVSADTGAR